MNLHLVALSILIVVLGLLFFVQGYKASRIGSAMGLLSRSGRLLFFSRLLPPFGVMALAYCGGLNLETPALQFGGVCGIGWWLGERIEMAVLGLYFRFCADILLEDLERSDLRLRSKLGDLAKREAERPPMPPKVPCPSCKGPKEDQASTFCKKCGGWPPCQT